MTARQLTDVAPVRPGEELDWARVRRWLGEAVPELSGPLSVLQFPHGRANLTYLLEAGGTRVVLRRPPFGDLAPGAHDMRREHRVLSRLWRSYPTGRLGPTPTPTTLRWPAPSSS